MSISPLIKFNILNFILANPNRKSTAKSIAQKSIAKASSDTGSPSHKNPVVHNRRDEVFSNPDNFTPDSKFQLDYFAKSEESKTIIRRSLQQHYLFENLGKDDMEKMVNCMKSVIYQPNAIIINEGDVGDQFFLIESGEAIASVIGVGDVAKYGVGGCFGELALIYNSPRAASVIAKSIVKTWIIDIK